MFAHHDMACMKGSVNYKNTVLLKIVKRHPSKNREMGGAVTLGGRSFVNRHNNQPKVGCDGGGVMMMRCKGGGTHGGYFFLSFWAANGATKKRERVTGPRP